MIYEIEIMYIFIIHMSCLEAFFTMVNLIFRSILNSKFQYTVNKKENEST